MKKIVKTEMADKPSSSTDTNKPKPDFHKAVTMAMNAKKLAKKQKRKRQKILLSELFVDFAKNTTLHGLKYINERGLSLIEKLFWLITFLLSMILCFLLIRNVWIKWKMSPVLVTFSEQFVPVGMVPFPSVTICPQIKCMPNVFKYSKSYEQFAEIGSSGTNSSESEINFEMLNDVSLVCDRFKMINDSNGNASVVEHLIEVAPDINDVFYNCLWRGNIIPCERLFHKVLTQEGVCYNFNSLSKNEIFNVENIQNDYNYLDAHDNNTGWNLSSGYDGDFKDPYPYRGRENGAAADLDVVLLESVDDRDVGCNSMNHGYKIYVHHPSDMPQSSLYYYAALANQVSSLALKFNMVTTSDSLQDYSPEVRQCYFQSERSLNYFKIYTQKNCHMECISMYVFKNCNCVEFHMPHEDSRHICRGQNLNCAYEATEELTDREMRSNLGLESKGCYCLPSCDSITYDAEILKTDFDANTFIQFQLKTDDTKESHIQSSFLEQHNLSRIQMYFKESRFISMRRTELFGVTDFLANCGGLLGLFLGFSFLSLVEIFYYITLRFCCMLKKDMDYQE